MEQGNRKRRNFMQRKKQVYQVLSRVFLAAIIGLLVINIILPSRTYSSSENRNLASRPALTWSSLSSGKFFSDFDTYYSDQFAGRDLWISIKALGNALMGNSESNSVIFGKKGYLMQYPTEPDMDAVNGTISAINTFTLNHPDLNQTMILVPDAANVLTNMLPANAPVRNQISDIQSLQSQLSLGITMVDAGTLLKNASANDQVFYKTDHHWTSTGAYRVFLGAASALGIDSVSNYTMKTVSDSFRGTLASRSGRNITKDTIEIYEPTANVSFIVSYPDSGTSSASIYDSSKLYEKDHYQIFFGGNHPLVEIRTTADNQRNLLIFKDSYANSFVQFLTPYFEKIILVDPRYYYDNIEIAMTSYGITDVLYLYSADTLLTDTGLADTLSAGAESAAGADEDISADVVTDVEGNTAEDTTEY